MNHNWQSSVLKRLAAVLGLSFAFGIIFDQVTIFLLLACAFYLAWTLRQLFMLGSWLENSSSLSDPQEPPTSRGSWGDIFDSIYRLMRKQEKLRDRLQAVIDRIQQSTSALQDAVVMTNRHSLIEWWNPAAEHILGLRSPDDHGQLITNLIRHPRFVSYFEQKSYQDPLDMPSPVSEQRTLLCSITLYGPDNRLILFRDNTRIHHLEQMSKDFVANVSHELRTPLTVITGYLETLAHSVEIMPQPPVPVLPKAVGQMQSQSHRMSNIIDDLLTLSKLETADSQQDIQPVSLPLLINTIVEDAKSLSGNKNHKIIFNCAHEDQILGNKKELRSAISNLIFNAVKYTPEGGNISIRWTVSLNTGYLTVKDDGIGIDPQHIPRLTERFYRVDKSRHASTGGTGLGLAIVKHVLLRHDATLLIKSRPGRGSSFTCQFPHSRLVKKAA
ncbi:phosphate regulon sensor histidine kinase PhoR [Sansalvadorimonas sp. 2012CJ34-2]|uniref:Phosphate regulon sensor protein PhoR n=1 Tax=Parendozoicomonas callyspongiae TaxID=2942213 RepID=A0ABT0PEL6_9GAMM|nr:phosphate regulon sensor histidine kinase PhoR [Sansalvadorimonas sp. 2012CJ34-2]